MSNRRTMFTLNTQENGPESSEAITLYRDEGSKSYRLFTALYMSNNDLSIEELTELRDKLSTVISGHEPWYKEL